MMVYFHTKIPNLEIYFEGLGIENVGICYGHWEYFTTLCYDRLIYFVVDWYIFPVLVCCTKRNLATLVSRPFKTT
jgi:hypothetical protein